MSSSSSKISKGKTATKPAVKSSLVGAPAQYKQPTRKGKKSWRKNIDVQPEEHAMEEARVQERDGGYVHVQIVLYIHLLI
jgi:nucleolar protein 53